MKHLKLTFLLFGIAFGIISCASSNSEYLTVASQRADCVGVAPQKCLLVKQDNDPNWTYLYQNIQGFNYVEGNEYFIKVKKERIKNPPADASSLQYSLIREISKTRKNSANLPR